ncbi:hypothetical protein SAMN05192559_10415 [Halobacillus karajensis]|uniref:hypothetical protein n=1 Tax=Halobacillus karajensis TaxID=195088 RepID=UPI0008A78F34|nr:hypothetical protein [Halobacillus karajensis]SEH77043.1 hypothetical protein SAMN05192559_10415 [Halobacillus karajensis]
MIHTLADIPLSAESKALVAQGYFTGASLEVSTVIKLNNYEPFNQNVFRELVIAGWGEKLGKYIEVFENRDAKNFEALLTVQEAVRSGHALFAICNIRTDGRQCCFLSIHHALADEHTLNIFSCLFQLAHEGMMELALHDINQGRQAYFNYVERQHSISKKNVYKKEIRNNQLKPVRLSKNGALAWNSKVKRVALSRIIPIIDIDITTVVDFLSIRGVISEGNTACLSKNCRLPSESVAIGMMTSLNALSIEAMTRETSHNLTSLEALAKHNLDARIELECCRKSELFINGATPRSIPASQVINTVFPVGMDLRRVSPSEFRLEFEGSFCDETAVNDLLTELANFLSNKKAYN